jgi:uncharacterized membrane protein
MTTATGTSSSPQLVADAPLTTAARPRVVSVDALRGLVIFTMIYVNDIAGAITRPPGG